MAKKFRDLAAPIYADPERRARVEAYERAMEAVLSLAKLREVAGMTQAEVAKRLDFSQANVSRIERQHDLYVSTLADYVGALGGQLQLVAVFPDQHLSVELGLPQREAAPA